MTLVLFFFYFSAKLVLPLPYPYIFAVFPLLQQHPKRVVKKNGQA